MNFVSGVLNQIPVVGTVKAGLHSIAGDTEGASKAFRESTRATAVIAGAITGGPLGAVGAGLAADAVMTVGTQNPQGVIRSVCKIGDHIDRGEVPILPVLETVLTPACDAIGAKAAGKVFQSVAKLAAGVTIEESGKTAVISIAKEIVAAETVVIAENIKAASVPIIYNTVVDACSDPCPTYSSRGGSSPPPSPPPNDDRPTTESAGKDSSTCSKSISTGSPSGGGPPNNPPKRTTETKSKRKLVKEILEILKKYFPNMRPNEIYRLELLVKTIIKNGFDMRVLVIIFTICKRLNINNNAMTFSSIGEFLMVYIHEQLFELTASSTDCDITVEELQEIIITNLLKISDKPCNLINDLKEFFEEMVGVERELHGELPTLEGFIVIFNEIMRTIIAEPRCSRFKDVYSALYHYYKHRKVVSMDTGVETTITVTEYFNLLEEIYLEVQRTSLYEQMVKTQEGKVSNEKDKVDRIEYTSPTKLFYGRKFKLVIKLQNGQIVVATFHWVY